MGSGVVSVMTPVESMNFFFVAISFSDHTNRTLSKEGVRRYGLDNPSLLNIVFKMQEMEV